MNISNSKLSGLLVFMTCVFSVHAGKSFDSLKKHVEDAKKIILYTTDKKEVAKKIEMYLEALNKLLVIARDDNVSLEEINAIQSEIIQFQEIAKNNAKRAFAIAKREFATEREEKNCLLMHIDCAILSMCGVFLVYLVHKYFHDYRLISSLIARGVKRGVRDSIIPANQLKDLIKDAFNEALREVF